MVISMSVARFKGAERQKKYKESVAEKEGASHKEADGTHKEILCNALQGESNALPANKGLPSNTQRDMPSNTQKGKERKGKEKEPAKAGSAIAVATTRAKPAIQNAPYGKIRDLFIEMLPMCTRPMDVDCWTPARKATIRARWQDQLPTLDAWKHCFTLVSQSKFLTGQSQPTNGRKPFCADLFWIAKPENLLKIYEDKYLD